MFLGDQFRKEIVFSISGSGAVHHGELEGDVGVEKSNHGRKVELPKLDISSHQTVFISQQCDASLSSKTISPLLPTLHECDAF